MIARRRQYELDSSMLDRRRAGEKLAAVANSVGVSPARVGQRVRRAEAMERWAQALVGEPLDVHGLYAVGRISARVRQIAQYKGATNLRELQAVPRSEMKRIPNIGKKAIDELDQCLKAFGLAGVAQR